MTIRRQHLLASTLFTAAAILCAAPQLALAQETVAGVADEATEVGEVVVTGTRLRLPDYVSSNPVASVTGATIEQAGVTNLTDFLTDMPALVGSTTLQDNADAGSRAQIGLNLLNLRNLGSQRTLVLVDGRRHVAASIFGQSPDINTIPIALIDRVEVLTGGASAIYGADGVSGVVNFVLKKDFEGVDARIQTGWSDEGGGGNTFGSLLFGKNFGDRANFTIGGEYSKTDRVSMEDRSYSTLAGRETLVNDPLFGQPGHLFQKTFLRDIRYVDTSPGGSIYTDPLNATSLSGVSFQGNGDPWVDGIDVGDFAMQGGSGSQLAAFQTDLLPKLERGSLNSTFRFELTPRHRLFGEAKYVRTETQFQSQPAFDLGLFIPIDNPFIPDNVVAASLATPSGFGTRFGAVAVAKDEFDFGFITRDVTRETQRYVGGIEGEFTDNLRYEASLNYGRTNEHNVEHNNRINERFLAAVDAVDAGQYLTGTPNGQIVCRSDLDPSDLQTAFFNLDDVDIDNFGQTFTPGPNSGCVPANIFGGGNVSQEARNWILTDSLERGKVEQFVANAYMSGDTTPWFSLPAGPLSFVLGGEFRKESASSTPGELELLGGQLGYDVTWLGQGQIVAGKYNVTEGFGELSVPLLKDMPFAKSLTIDGAYRYSRYSTIGVTEASKFGAKWQLNDSLMFRATQAKSVRAPDLSELFQPQTQTFADITDPCDNDEFQAGPQPTTREANCRAALGITGAYTFNNTFSAGVEGVIGGNPDLGPEEATTWTLGMVFTPKRIIPGFSFAIDYYDIELKDAIQFFSAQSIVDKCYDLPQPNQFCSLVSRDPGTGFVNGFQQFGVNVAQYKTRGYDYSVRYIFDPMRFGMTRDIGRFGVSVVGNKLEELTFTEDPNDPQSIDKDLGDAFTPEWQASTDLTWEYKNLFVNYGFNYFSETRVSSFVGRPGNYVDPKYVKYPHRATSDVQVRYTVKDGLDVYGGVNNIADQKPFRGETDYPVGPLGRFMYVGAKLRM